MNYTEPVLSIVKACIEHGDFVLSSGKRTTWRCDLLLARHAIGYLGDQLTLLGCDYPAGILTGGGLLAMAATVTRNVLVDPRTKRVYHPEGKRVDVVDVVDDVVTTEGSLYLATELLEAAGYIVGGYYCVLDRRPPERRTLPVRSLVTAAELGLNTALEE